MGKKLDLGFADRLEQRMDALGLTQAKVAKHFSISREAVTLWAKGGLPDRKKWQPLADLLQCNREWLIFNRGPMEAEVFQMHEVDFIRRMRQLRPDQRASIESHLTSYEMPAVGVKPDTVGKPANPPRRTRTAKSS